MQKILEKQKFGELVSLLEAYDVYAPRHEDDVWNFKPANGSAELTPEYGNTVHSPKKIVFPQREVFFEFEHVKGEMPVVTEVKPDHAPTVVFGVRPCDGVARTKNDKVFAGELSDAYYWERRDKTVNVGLACNRPHSSNCFCISTGGSPHGTDGLDILMTDMGDEYHLQVLTDQGKEIANLAGKLLKDAKDADEKKRVGVQKAAEGSLLRSVKGLDKSAENLKAMFDAPFWDEQSKACISCGICTYLCPTCHCFDINDEVTSDSPLKGQRVRTWDTCQYPDFTMHTSGHNPRSDAAARMRQRICHKFEYFVENYEEFQCTGCGRCISECPVSIDIAATMNKVADYEG